MKKFFFALILGLMLILGLSTVASADIVDSGACGDNLTWALDSYGMLTISGSGLMDDYSDTSKAPWNKERENIRYVFINDSVASIGDYAFEWCTNLSDVVIPDRVLSIGKKAFFYCSSLTSVKIGSSVDKICDYAFGYCTSLKEVSIPDSTTCIEYQAFYDCISLTSVSIGSGVTSIGDHAFSYCDSLTSINVDSRNAYYSSQNGVLFNKGETELIRCPGGKSGIYIIPTSVTSIKDYAFYYCTSLASVIIPESVLSIGDEAFFQCTSIISVTILGGVTSIGKEAFYYCTSLNSINIPDSVTSIGGRAFMTCTSLTNITIGSGVTKIGYDAFHNCNGLTEVVIPSGVISMGDGAFSNCESLTNVIIQDGVSSIGNMAFTHCLKLSEITIPDSVISIGMGAFDECTNLSDVYYGGVEKQWEAISIDDFMNDPLFRATIHFKRSTIYCLDDTSRVQVFADSGVLPVDFNFVVNELEPTEPDVVSSYEIYFKKDGKRVQPYGDVTVSLPVPEGVDSSKCKVYYTDENGNRTDMHAVYQDGNMVFTTDHFSKYVIAVGGGHVATLDDYTQGFATITGIVSGNTYSGETTFTVACDDACAVLYTTDGGETYTRLKGTAVDNGYSFTVDVTQDMTIVVALKGDVNLDGVLKNQDVTMAKAANLGKRTLSTLQEIVADVTGDGVFKNQDITKFKAALLGKTTLSWDI